MNWKCFFCDGVFETEQLGWVSQTLVGFGRKTGLLCKNCEDLHYAEPEDQEEDQEADETFNEE